MPAITSTITAVAGLGASIGQMIKASQTKKKAAELGLQSTIQAKSEVPINTLTDLGIADREFEKGMIRDLEANAISTLQQDPRTALGGTANINRQTEEQTAKLGQQIAEDVIERDRLIATQDQEIEDTRSTRAYDIAKAEAEGYGEMEADAQSEFNTAATAAIGLGADIGAEAQKYAAWKKANVSKG